MSEIEGRPGCDDLVLRENKEPFSMVWLDSGEKIDTAGARLMYTDDEGKDYDVEAMRDALIAIQANTKPTAVSLSLKNRISAIYQICCQALPE